LLLLLLVSPSSRCAGWSARVCRFCYEIDIVGSGMLVGFLLCGSCFGVWSFSVSAWLHRSLAPDLPAVAGVVASARRAASCGATLRRSWACSQVRVVRFEAEFLSSSWLYRSYYPALVGVVASVCCTASCGITEGILGCYSGLLLWRRGGVLRLHDLGITRPLPVWSHPCVARPHAGSQNLGGFAGQAFRRWVVDFGGVLN
jgi:hypothetical protein